MVGTPVTTLPIRATLLGALLFTGACGYVKRDDFESEVARLRQEMSAGDARVSAEVTALERRMEARMESLDVALRDLEDEFGARVERLETSLRVHAPVHFGFDDASLRDDQVEVLERLAYVLMENYPEAVLTVEGFTDPAGSAEYNLRLGRARAEEVRSHLIAYGVMEDQVRAVSYGESADRQVIPGAAGPGNAGRENRRAVVVIDHPDAARMADLTTQQ
jgi:outer membrane protein OmpA-like peptidoglycan-associated protein